MSWNPAGPAQGPSPYAWDQPAGPPTLPYGDGPTARGRRPRRRRIRRLIILAAVVLVVVGGAVGITVAATSGVGESRDVTIDKAVTAYAAAVAAGDVNTLRSATCEADAGRFTELGVRGGVVTRRPTTTVTETRVNGEDAAVTISTGSGAPVTVYFRREGGNWKACPSAVGSFETK